MPKFSPHAVANYLLELGERDNVEISPMKLQKLVYYAHGWHLGITGEPLINEQIECWQYGPVVRSLFHQFKDFGSSAITRKATKFKLRKPNEKGVGFFKTITPTISERFTDERTLIETVWDSYKEYGPIRLSNMTHAEGEPWRTVFEKWDRRPPKGTDIPQDLIRQYFESKLTDDT